MPSIKDFDKKNKAAKVNVELNTDTPASESRSKRRPGREAEPVKSEAKVQVVDVDEGVIGAARETAQEIVAETNQQNDKSSPASEPQVEEMETNKVEINFFGSELLRARFPTPFKVMEAVATDWVHDGKFEGLPLGHPLVQFFAAKGLQQAKSLEKKVLESPALEKAAMKAFEAGLKAQQGIAQVKGQVEFVKNVAEAQINEVKQKIGKK